MAKNRLFSWSTVATYGVPRRAPPAIDALKSHTSHNMSLACLAMRVCAGNRSEWLQSEDCRSLHARAQTNASVYTMHTHSLPSLVHNLNIIRRSHRYRDRELQSRLRKRDFCTFCSLTPQQRNQQA
jgi:hypothetical protein